MFSFFSKDDSVLVQTLYRSGNSLAFACEALLEAEGGLKVRDRDGGRAQVQVHHRRRAHDQSWIYFAELIEGTLEPEWPTPGYQWRQTSRFPIGVRVRSPQLPEYSALTEDLSPDGAQIQTSGPLQVGQEIEIFLDLDSGFPDVRTIARVAWSRMTHPFKAGLAFVDTEPQDRISLTSFLGERDGQIVMPGLADDNADGGSTPGVLEKMALLQSSFDDGDALVLKLVTHDEVMEIRFRGAKVLQSDLSSQLVGRIVTQPTPEGQTRTWLLGPEGATLVEIESAAPEIFCRALRTHDLG